MNKVKFDPRAIGLRLAELAASFVANAVEAQPGATDEEQIEAATEQAWIYFEKCDHLLPFIGPYLDLPAVDVAQRALIRPQVRALIAQAHKEAQPK